MVWDMRVYVCEREGAGERMKTIILAPLLFTFAEAAENIS